MGRKNRGRTLSFWPQEYVSPSDETQTVKLSPHEICSFVQLTETKRRGRKDERGPG